MEKNYEGKDKSYLINYNKNKSEYITLILNGHVNSDYNDDKLLQPLIETVEVIQVKNVVSNWNEGEYGLSYYEKEVGDIIQRELSILIKMEFKVTLNKQLMK
jgi:cell fate (sporulation/competence/biofilm development) regulator YlbF (YheA/YmcA/DUF963 family)